MTLPIKPRSLPANAKEVFQGLVHSVWQWDQELFDGSHTTFEAIKRRDYVGAVGVLPDQRLLLIKDEQPDRPAVITPAGGGLEDHEDAATAIRREFREETGYAIGELRPWLEYQPGSRVFMVCHIYIGRDLTHEGEPTPEAGEKISLYICQFEEFIALGRNQQLRDWLMRIELLEAALDPAKRETLKRLLYAP